MGISAAEGIHMARRFVVAILIAMLSAISAFAASASAATENSGDPGKVRFVKRMDSNFDPYVTSGNAATQQWINAKFWRMEVFNPFFDAKTAWYAKGWVYDDSTAIYPGTDMANQHPDWILHDSAGNKLYIPWGCSNGSCPQYAADVTNPAFRAAWIATLKSELAQGYTGAWIDDVNLELRISDGGGNDATAYSPTLGRNITAADWRDAMATFMEEVRAAVPANKEILHNTLWYAGQGAGGYNNPDVIREIKSADYINREGGVNDGGLTGGTGQWSLRNLQGFIDKVHSLGKGVILDGFDASAAGREYSLANYELISNGNDGVGEMSQTPDNWWKGWDTDLGQPKAGRFDWNGLQRRDFTGGMALVNDPQSATRTVTLPNAMTNTSGQSVTTVTLAGGQGAVLTGAVTGGSASSADGTSSPKAPAPDPAPAPSTSSSSASTGSASSAQSGSASATQSDALHTTSGSTKQHGSAITTKPASTKSLTPAQKRAAAKKAAAKKAAAKKKAAKRKHATRRHARRHATRSHH
jgi:hypothetical protein